MITGPTTSLYKELVASTGITKTGWSTHTNPGGGWNSGNNSGDSASLARWAQGLAAAWQKGGVRLSDVGVTSVKDEPGWNFPYITDFANTNPTSLAGFHLLLQQQGISPGDVGAETWPEVTLINRSAATSLPLKRRLYWSLRFPSWYEARSWHNATLAMQSAFSPSMSTFVNWNNWAGRFYTPGC